MSNNYLRLLNNDSGSNYSFSDNVEDANVPRSGFNLSFVTSGTAEQGQLLPVMCKLTQMKEDFELSLQSIIKVVNPPTVPLLSRQRAFFHGYWASFAQLWKGAQTFFSKNTSLHQAIINRTIPKIAIPVSYLTNTDLANFLGFNFANLPVSGTVEVNALKFMMYIKVWRDFYINKRIFSTYLYNKATVQSDTTSELLYNFLFPEDEADFRIGSSQWYALIEDEDCIKFLCEIKFRDYANDYFTSAQLVPIIGEVPNIPINIDSATANFVSKVSSDYNLLGHYNTGTVGSNTFEDFYSSQYIGGSQNGNYASVDVVPYGATYNQSDNILSIGYDSARLGLITNYNKNNSPNNATISTSAFVQALNNSASIEFSSGSINAITTDAIRNLASATAILEKLAKTDGSYREFAKIMFGERPKSAYDFTPTLLGGCVQSILFSDVVNTTGSFSGTTATSPVQGTTTGKGLSAGSGSIGRFHSDDFGYIMVLMSIMPDTYYHQGLDRTDCYEVPEDFYVPDRANLGMQAILNKEIYNDPTSEDNDKVFGYINRFDELRYNQNEVHGKLADPNNNTFFPYIQTRHFESLPSLSPEFLSTKDNISKDWLSSQDEVPYIYQIAFNFRGVRPLPYRASPEYFGM